MDKAINYYEIKQELAAIGLNSPNLHNQLREQIFKDNDQPEMLRDHWRKENEEYVVGIWLDKQPDGRYSLQYYDAGIRPLLRSGGENITQQEQNALSTYVGFESQVPIESAFRVVQLLREKSGLRNPDDWDIPLSYPQVHELLSFPKNKLQQTIKNGETMNDQNLSYLQKQLLNLGFGEKMNADLEQKISSKEKEFTLNTSETYNKTDMAYMLHYKAGDKEDMYFFNKYDAKLKDEQQTFYLNNGSGITAKEAFNLLEGRAVHKELENKAGEKYKAWVVLDKSNRTENGNAKLQTYSDGWNFKPERAIDVMDIVGINDAGAREKLLKSLEKGNRHQVEAMKNGKPTQLFIEANPAEHRVNLTNYKGEAQRLEDYKKPEAKQEQKKEQTQKQADDGTKKKRTRQAKQHV